MAFYPHGGDVSYVEILMDSSRLMMHNKAMTVGDRQTADLLMYAMNMRIAFSSRFTRMSGGGIRNVIHDIENNVVYKVDDMNDNWSAGTLDNRVELRNARNLRKRSVNGWIGNVYIPEVTPYRLDGSLVLAMEFIEGVNLGWSSNQYRNLRVELHKLRFNDMHPDNFLIINDGTGICPIDMGSVRNSYSDDRCLIATDQRW